MTNTREHGTASPAADGSADGPAPEMQTKGPLLQQFLTLEASVWQALVSGDAAADAALLSDDFLGVYPSGFSGHADHCGQLDQGPVMEDFTLTEPQLRVISADAVLFSYRARYRRSGHSLDEVMYISSLWQKRAAGWINTFSQDTPAAPNSAAE